MTNSKKIHESIHLRAVKYGYERPNGFSYEKIEKHYSNRVDEWEVVKESLQEAINNKLQAGITRVTPFVLLQRPAGDIKGYIFTLSYEAYFNYLEYLELVEARQNSRQSFWLSFIAIVLSLITLSASIYYSNKQIDSPAKVDENQFQQLLRAIPMPKDTIRVNEEQLQALLKALS
jgi:hypothetical protein